MDTINKTLKFMNDDGVESEFCPTVCEDHVIVGDGDRTLKEELNAIKRRLSSNQGSTTLQLTHPTHPFTWGIGQNEDDLEVEVSMQGARLSDISVIPQWLKHPFKAVNLFYGNDFFGEDVNGNGIPDGWTAHSYGFIHEGKPNRGVTRLSNGKLLIDASSATAEDNEVGVSIPIEHLVKKDCTYAAIVKLGMAQPSNTSVKLQCYSLTEENRCTWTDGVKLHPRQDTVFYFDPYHVWFEDSPSSAIKLESIKLDLFVIGSGKVVVESISLFEIPRRCHALPPASNLDPSQEYLEWEDVLSSPTGVELRSTSPSGVVLKTQALWGEPLLAGVTYPDVINLSTQTLYRWSDEDDMMLSKPITFPVTVLGDDIDEHLGVCHLIRLAYVSELPYQAEIIRYELRSQYDQSEGWFEVDEDTYFEAKSYDKRALIYSDEPMDANVTYRIESASYVQRLELTYTQLLQHENIIREVVKHSDEVLEQVEILTDKIQDIEEQIGTADLSGIIDDLNKVKEQVDDIQEEIDRPIEEEDVNDIIDLIKGVDKDAY